MHEAWVLLLLFHFLSLAYGKPNAKKQHTHTHIFVVKNTPLYIYFSHVATENSVSWICSCNKYKIYYKENERNEQAKMKKVKKEWICIPWREEMKCSSKSKQHTKVMNNRIIQCCWFRQCHEILLGRFFFSSLLSSSSFKLFLRSLPCCCCCYCVPSMLSVDIVAHNLRISIVECNFIRCDTKHAFGLLYVPIFWRSKSPETQRETQSEYVYVYMIFNKRVKITRRVKTVSSYCCSSHIRINNGKVTPVMRA